MPMQRQSTLNVKAVKFLFKFSTLIISKTIRAKNASQISFKSTIVFGAPFPKLKIKSKNSKTKMENIVFHLCFGIFTFLAMEVAPQKLSLI